MTKGKQWAQWAPRSKLFILALCTATGLTALGSACGSKKVSDASSSKGPSSDNKTSLPDTGMLDPQNPENPQNPQNPGENSQAQIVGGHSYITDVLLFNGVGISTSDWQTTETILKSAKMSYQLVNSKQLDAMTLDQMTNFGVMIFPGGNGYSITGGLLLSTAVRIRQAVRDRAVGYVGFCAGAWVSVGPEALTNNTAAYGFAVAKGGYLIEYAPGGKYPEATMENVSFADGSHRQLVWWGGPKTPNWVGGVIAKYVTGEPAISQTWVGKGYVVISGVHPEAPQSWRYTAGYDSDGLDYDIAMKMIRAALYQSPMAAF